MAAHARRAGAMLALCLLLTACTPSAASRSVLSESVPPAQPGGAEPAAIPPAGPVAAASSSPSPGQIAQPTAMPRVLGNWPTEGVVTSELLNAQGEVVGQATLIPLPQGGVLINLQLSKLPPGPHAIHIHEVDRCDPPDFRSAGGHFNPEGRKHGLRNPNGPHAGDLPNLIVGSDGAVRVDLVATQVRLTPGRGSLLGPNGTALVIHAGPDDYDTDPDGNSGDRIACGTISR